MNKNCDDQRDCSLFLFYMLLYLLIPLYRNETLNIIYLNVT